ncbi:MAG: response regulator transcription factor [Rhodospirillaceae bacterium]
MTAAALLLPAPRLLLIDDDDSFRESVGYNLSEAGFTVVDVPSGPAALELLARDRSFALVLLDWKMPGMSGIEVLRRMRESGFAVPVIFLTMLSNQIYEEAALQGGAVDFVEKSRSFAILLKRVILILAGTKGETMIPVAAGPAPGTVVRCGLLELHRDCCRASWAKTAVLLTITEFKLVDFLVTRAGQDAGYRELYDIVRGAGFVAGYGEEGYRSNIRAFVKRIRRKFRDVDENFDEIESYSGFGYRWREREVTDSRECQTIPVATGPIP